MSLGETLRTRRRQRNLSLEHAAQQTRIQARFLKALEEETFDIFPAKVYLEGFLRRYAGFLALDGEELIKELHTAQKVVEKKAPAHHSTSPQERQKPSDTPPPIRTEVFFLVGVLALLGGIYIFKAKPFSQRVLPSARPQAHSTVPSNGQATGHQLNVRPIRNVWVRVWADDQIRFEGTLRSGMSRAWNGTRGFRIAASDVSALELTVDGEPLISDRTGQGQIVWPMTGEVPPAAPVPGIVSPPVAAPVIQKQPVPKPPAPKPSPATTPEARPAPQHFPEDYE